MDGGKRESTSQRRGEPSADFAGRVQDNVLAVKLSELARLLQGEAGVQDTLDAITAAAVDTVPGAQYAGLTLVRAHRKVETRAATDELVRQVDEVQYALGEGPCLDATYERCTVRLPDMATERRWPRFTRRVRDFGIMSMLSFQLFVEQDNMGALNLYSREKDAFDDDSEQVGLLFAAHAAVAMSGARHEEQLMQALAVRDLIGQAKGILMERHKVTANEAFLLLVRASQETNMKLADISRCLADTGELSGSGHP